MMHLVVRTPLQVLRVVAFFFLWKKKLAFLDVSDEMCSGKNSQGLGFIHREKKEEEEEETFARTKNHHTERKREI